MHELTALEIAFTGKASNPTGCLGQLLSGSDFVSVTADQSRLTVISPKIQLLLTVQPFRTVCIST